MYNKTIFLTKTNKNNLYINRTLTTKIQIHINLITPNKHSLNLSSHHLSNLKTKPVFFFFSFLFLHPPPPNKNELHISQVAFPIINYQLKATYSLVLGRTAKLSGCLPDSFYFKNRFLSIMGLTILDCCENKTI